MAKQRAGKRSTSEAEMPVRKKKRADAPGGTTPGGTGILPVRNTSQARKRGYFVAFAFAKDAEREAAAFYKRTPPERIIKLLTVQEILDEEHVQKM